MARLEIQVDGKDVSAEKMLQLALSIIRILRRIEKEIAKSKPKAPRIRWLVDMQSGRTYGLIAIRSVENDASQELTELVWAEVQKRLAA